MKMPEPLFILEMANNHMGDVEHGLRIISELQTAFQMGFFLFLPFLVIDLLVSTILMSLGMMMMPPAVVALPFKLLLFVLVDGWQLVVKSLVESFNV
jgi:flagellar biosynthetic protein FliP